MFSYLIISLLTTPFNLPLVEEVILPTDLLALDLLILPLRVITGFPSLSFNTILTAEIVIYVLPVLFTSAEK